MADSGANLAKEEEAVGHYADDQPPPYNPSYGTHDAAPPNYDGTTSNVNDPPPSYESLYGRVRDAKQNSSGFMDFMKTFFIIIISTIGCTICVGLVLAIPIAMIVIGAMYLHDCPAQSYIPIYLIVGGVFGAVKNISNMLQRCRNRQENDEEANAKTNPFDGLIGCFLLAWFIAGNVWIYQIYDNFSEEPGAPNYCNPTLYYFAFWLTTVGYILIATLCCCFCCCGCLASCVDNKENN